MFLSKLKNLTTIQAQVFKEPSLFKLKTTVNLVLCTWEYKVNNLVKKVYNNANGFKAAL